MADPCDNQHCGEGWVIGSIRLDVWRSSGGSDGLLSGDRLCRNM